MEFNINFEELEHMDLEEAKKIVSRYVTRSGSYFSDYYYEYAPLQVNQLAQKVIPQQIIRTIVTFADKENN